MSAYVLPTSLADADNSLKLEYDQVMLMLGSSESHERDPGLTQRGTRLAEALALAAATLGSSRQYEYSPEIPALVYWAAQLARRVLPGGDARLQQYEKSLRYYANFESTAWLWAQYLRG